jgi:hypothetical protein
MMVGLVGLWCLKPLSTIFRLYPGSQFIGGGNRSSQRKPPEETYAMLHKYNIFFNDGNAERVDTLSYGWKKLINPLQDETISW